MTPAKQIEWIDTTEAARRLGVSRSRILALIASGRLETEMTPGWPGRGRHLIDPAKLAALEIKQSGRPKGSKTRKNLAS